MATWPTRKQYVGAIQRAASSFREPTLQQAHFETDLLGMPALSSGQTAIVFKAQVGGAAKAVRVFTIETTAGQARYRALADHLRTNRVPTIAEAVWIDGALDIDGGAYPVVVMEWVEGDSLATATEDRLAAPNRLGPMADRWRSQVAELRRARIAHGDLQHGNVIVDPGERFRFIDLDGVWIPAVSGEPPSEFGQPNYQHPDRTSGAVWGEHIDWFSALVIYVSLKALAADPALWRYHHGDNLIFRDTDFRGEAAIWHDLTASPDPEVVDLGRLLADCCNADPLAATDLDSVLQERAAPRASAGTATGTSGGATGTSGTSNGSASDAGTADADAWWNSTGSSVGSAPGSGPPPDPPRRPSGRGTRRDQPSAGHAAGDGAGVPRQRQERPKEQVRADWGNQQPSGAPPPPGGRPPSGAQPSGPGQSPGGATVGGVSLTDVQWQIVQAYATGFTVEQIAASRNVQAKTVKAHLRKVCRQAGVPALNDIPAWLAANGYTPPGGWPRPPGGAPPPPPGTAAPPPGSSAPPSGWPPPGGSVPPPGPHAGTPSGSSGDGGSGAGWAGRAALGALGGSIGIALTGGSVAVVVAGLVITVVLSAIWLLVGED